MVRLHAAVGSAPLAVALFFIGTAPSALADPFTFTSLSVAGSASTRAFGINNSGEVVGEYTTSGPYQGFSFSGGVFTNPIGTTDQYPTGVNNSGEITGFLFSDSSAAAFLNIGGVFSASHYPGPNAFGNLPVDTYAYGINDLGQIVGYADNGTIFGFLLSGGVYTGFSFPGTANPHSATSAFGINNSGQIVGDYSTGGVTLGFLLSGGVYTSLAFPGAAVTEARGINNNGQIVGIYATPGASEGDYHGFLLSGGVYTTIDFPGASSTLASGINDLGQITGSYNIGNETINGFLAMPTSEPGSFAMVLLGAGCLGVCLFCQRIRPPLRAL